MSLSLSTNSLSQWTNVGSANSDGVSINVISSGSIPLDIGTLLGVDPTSFINVTNGAGIRYTSTITVPSTATLTFSWTILTGDMGSTFYNDKAYVTISGHSIGSNNGTFLIASTTTVPTSGIYTKNIDAGTFSIGFASFNSGDETVNLSLTFSNVLFTYGSSPEPEPQPQPQPQPGVDVITIQGPGALFGETITNVTIPLVYTLDIGDCLRVNSDGATGVPPVPLPVSGTIITSPPLTNNNGQAGITFEVISTRTIYITNLACFFNAFANTTFQVWYRIGGVQHIFGSPPAITSTNGWTLVMLQVPVSGTGLSPLFLPYNVNITIPSDTPVGFYIGSNSINGIIAYQTYASGTGEFTDGILTVRTASNAGYGGPIANPSLTPRQFLGRVLYTSTDPTTLSDTGYRYYRWQITSLRNFITANSVQAAEFRFLRNGIDYNMSSVIVTNPLGSNPAGEIENVTKLIDGLFTTKWLDYNFKVFSYSEVVFDFGADQTRTFTGYRWATANDGTERDPVSWRVFGSANGTSWTTLHTVASFVPTTARQTWQTAQSMTTTGSFRYYRWYITGVQTFSLATSVHVAEFAFQSGGVDQSMAGVTITNPNGSNPASQIPSSLVDTMAGSKWSDLNIKVYNLSNVIFDFGLVSPVFNGYRWMTADDAIERDPTGWTISGSNDNTNWTTLHTVTNFAPTTVRNIWQTQQTYGAYDATITTSSVSSITATTCVGGGDVTATNGLPILVRGVCYSTTTDPTIDLLTKTAEIGSFGTGSFTVSISGLTVNTFYYVRAYATNSINATTYGSNVTFTTLTSVPSVTTDSGTTVSSGSSIISATITSIGGLTVTTRGVCWDTSTNPTIALTTKTVQTGSFGTGSFTATTSDMLNNTIYYVRAYATNSLGTSYGANIVVSSNPYVITAGIKVPVGSAGMTILQNQSDDDSFTFSVAGITTPRTMNFSIPFYTTAYSQPYFISNTYICFGSGATNFSGLSLGPTPIPALRTLHLGSADNSWQRCYESSATNAYRFRYEGTASTSGTVGSPNIVYEVTFYKQQVSNADIYIEIVFGVHGRTSGVWGMTNGLSSTSNINTAFGSLTGGTGLVGISGALQANRSYVLVLTSTGQFKNLYSGYYIVSSV